nr:chemosensory protein [Lasioderma serricorne]
MMVLKWNKKKRKSRLLTYLIQPDYIWSEHFNFRSYYSIRWNRFSCFVNTSICSFHWNRILLPMVPTILVCCLLSNASFSPILLSVFRCICCSSSRWHLAYFALIPGRLVCNVLFRANNPRSFSKVDRYAKFHPNLRCHISLCNRSVLQMQLTMSQLSTESTEFR